MIRLTEAQCRKLTAGMARGLNAPKPKPPMKSKVKSRLKEADVTKQCVQLMEAHGWKAIRLQRGLMRRRDGSVAMTIGEKGMCDWCFVKSAVSLQPFGSVDSWSGHSIFMFAEFKAPGKKPSDPQMAFMARCRTSGLVAEWFDNYDSFAGFVRMTFGVK